MKIYTEVIYFWDDDKGELVQESSKSYDYEGPLTLANGGGAGGSSGSEEGVNATANTGGGGGGQGDGTTFTAGNGGSGVVIIRILTASYSGTVTGSPTVTTDGLYTVITFTGTGTYTT